MSNIAHVSSKNGFVMELERSYSQFDQNFGTVRPQCFDFRSPTEDGPLSGLYVMPQPLAMTFAERSWNDELCQLLANDLFSREPKNPFSRRIEFYHPTFGVHRDDAVERTFQDRAI